MIVAEQKPIEEIKGFLSGHKRIVVLGCGTCVTVCLAGGAVKILAERNLLFWLSLAHCHPDNMGKFIAHTLLRFEPCR